MWIPKGAALIRGPVLIRENSLASCRTFTSYNMANIFVVSQIFFYFACLKACEKNRQNVGKSENIGHIVLITVR